MSDVDTQLAAIAQNQKTTCEKLDKVLHILDGNGNPDSGLIVRFDRVEQKFLKERREKSSLKMMLIGAVIGFVANAGLFVAQLVSG
jgi:hypothetical protein